MKNKMRRGCAAPLSNLRGKAVGRVVKAYASDYTRPWRMRRGERLTVRRKETSWKGFLWVEKESGEGRWAPEKYVQRNGNAAVAVKNLDATELSVRYGDRLTVLREESGWLWCATQDGRRGWVPADNIETEKASDIAVRPLRETDWDLVARLFGANGACGGCWCMWWRVEKGGKLWAECRGQKNRSRLRELVQGSKVHAVLAFHKGEPVGWCSFGPRRAFPRLETVRALRHPSTETTWAVVCFFIPARWRGQGLATKLLAAATDRAFELGATRIEGYPAVPKSGPMPVAFAWTGVPAVFKKCGYREVRRPEASRPIFFRTSPRKR